MPHLILILPTGETVVVEHEGEGNKTAFPVSATAKVTDWESISTMDHPPSQIINLDTKAERMAEVVKFLKKFY